MTYQPSHTPLKLTKLFIQLILIGLSFAVLGLIIKAFNELSDDKQRLQTLLPGAQLHTNQIVAIGIALLIVSILTIITSILNSIYISIEKLPYQIRRWLPDRFPLKSMALNLFILTPIDLAQTIITATDRAHVSSPVLSESIIESFIFQFTGKSLNYSDRSSVRVYTILSWIVWLILIIGISIEFISPGAREHREESSEREVDRVEKA